MNIVICDDSTKEASYLKNAIESHFDCHNILVYYNGISLIEYMEKNEPDLILLDIEMQGLNGIETARKIRETHPQAVIIFITAHTHFAHQAFGVYAFDYIIKPFNKERLLKSLSIIANRMNFEEKYVEVHNRGTIFRINQKDIIFIEKDYNKCSVYTEQFTYIMRTPLRYFEEQLDTSVFIKTHQGFIVNKSKINMITSKGNLAYDIHFTGTDRTASLSRGMNEKFHLV